MDALVRAALDARARAHAPYSRFAVGAALRTEAGEVFAGCNVENAAYPLGACAEAGAISAMVLGGGRRIAEIVVAGGGAEPCTPCGGCRQRLREFAGATLRVRIVDETGRCLLDTSLAALLPHAFGPDNLAR
jgi:cytidine deaminase